MNREIKFRAWLEGTHENMTIEVPKMEYDILLNNGIYHIEGWGSYTTIPIMQFTGLHDKNGKEIYEGDVLEITTLINQQEDVFDEEENVLQTIICKVVYKNEFACFDLETIEEDRFLKKWGFYGTDNSEFTVIGNIYENPEILSGGEK